MAISWHEMARKFKSPLSVVAAFLLRSRDTQRARNQQLQEKVKQHNEQHERDAQEIARQQRQAVNLAQSVAVSRSARPSVYQRRTEQEKLGWVAEYAEDIKVWDECQQVVSKSLTFINE